MAKLISKKKGTMMSNKHGASKKTPVGSPKKTVKHTKHSPKKISTTKGDKGFQAYRKKMYGLGEDAGKK